MMFYTTCMIWRKGDGDDVMYIYMLQIVEKTTTVLLPNQTGGGNDGGIYTQHMHKDVLVYCIKKIVEKGVSGFEKKQYQKLRRKRNAKKNARKEGKMRLCVLRAWMRGKKWIFLCICTQGEWSMRLWGALMDEKKNLKSIK